MQQSGEWLWKTGTALLLIALDMLFVLIFFYSFKS